MLTVQDGVSIVEKLNCSDGGGCGRKRGHDVFLCIKTEVKRD